MIQKCKTDVDSIPKCKVYAPFFFYGHLFQTAKAFFRIEKGRLFARSPATIPNALLAFIKRLCFGLFVRSAFAKWLFIIIIIWHTTDTTEEVKNYNSILNFNQM